MKINGLQKLTLLDFPGHVACTVFLAGCNLRCPFCHNSDLLTAEAEAVMDDASLLTFLKSRQGLLEGVAFTGGEPLMRAGLPELMEKIRALGYPVKLDTNGCFPDRLKDVVRAGLVDYVAMDIKNSKERYAVTVGFDDGEDTGEAAFDLAPVEESVRFLLEGTVDYEFRTTTVNELHDEDSFRGIGAWIAGARRYYLQPFTDRDTVLYAGLTTPQPETLERYRSIVAPFVREVHIRGELD